MSAPELSRLVAVDRMPPLVVVEAGEEERARVALRLHIPAVGSLRCAFALRRDGEAVTAEGALEADVVQTCVVSLEPVEQRVVERFTVRFVPAGREADDGDPESLDEIGYAGSTIDLGEAAVEQLALALDPYPRHVDAVLDRAATDDDAGPFGVLDRLQLDS